MDMEDSIIERVLGEVPLEDGLATLLGGLPDGWRQGRDSFSIRCFLPGHEDRNASMTAYAGQGRCWCHACHRGGNLLNLTQILLGCDCKDAINYWCQRLGILKTKPSEEVQRRVSDGKRIIELREAAHWLSIRLDQRLPKPKNDYELAVLDEIYHEKNLLDEAYRRAIDVDSLERYMRELWRWESWAQGVWKAAVPQEEFDYEEAWECL